MSFCLIILAGGNSRRFRSNVGKPYQKIAGKSLVEINIDKARKFKQIKKIILVYKKKDLKRVKSLKLKNVKFILGGKNRQLSTFNALKYLKNIKGITKVLIPEENEKNLEDVPEEIKKKLEIVLVKHLDDVIQHALEKLPVAIDWDEKDFVKAAVNKDNIEREGLVKH